MNKTTIETIIWVKRPWGVGHLHQGGPELEALGVKRAFYPVEDGHCVKCGVEAKTGELALSLPKGNPRSPREAGPDEARGRRGA